MKSKELKKLIRQLVVIEPNDSPLISCFVNLEHPQNDYSAKIEPQARLTEKRLSGKRHQDYMEAMERVRTFLRSSIKPQSRSLAVYSRGGDDPVFIAVEFKAPLKTMFVVDSLPHVYPLVELKDNFHRFVNVLTTETEARILETTVGSVTEEILTTRPDLRQRIGREWTREHYRNHKNEREQQFIREKIRILEELVKRGAHNCIIIAGSPKMANRLSNALPVRLKEMLIDTLSSNPKSGLSPILLEAMQLFASAENEQSHKHVESLEAAVLTGGFGVAGYDATKEALIGAFADMLFVDQDLTEVGVREELVRLATHLNVTIETVRGSEILKRLSGIGCLLRYRPIDFHDGPLHLAA